jgi:hypothetical protein
MLEFFTFWITLVYNCCESFRSYALFPKYNIRIIQMKHHDRGGAVFPATVQGVHHGGDPFAGAAMGCLPQCSWGHHSFVHNSPLIYFHPGISSCSYGHAFEPTQSLN